VGDGETADPIPSPAEPDPLPLGAARGIPTGGASATLAATATDNCSVAEVACTPASGTFPLGSTPATCTGKDGSGNMGSCGTSVTVVDTTPPNVMAVTATPSSLWPPDNKLVPVAVAASVSDICDPTVAATCKVISVNSNEPGTSPLWQIIEPLTVNPRTERLGSGSGRIYTITMQCTDKASNAATNTVAVTVPRDQGQ
jgi:hypothetical protein